MREFRLKYPGQCLECQAELPIGSVARYYGRGRMYGTECHEQKSNGQAHKPSVRLIDILTEANDVAKKAYDDYCSEHYRQPAFVVTDDMDNNKVVGTMFDVCGFVWMEVSWKEGQQLIRAFKREGVKGGRGYEWSGDKEWRVDSFKLRYYKGSSRYGSPWKLNAPAVGYGNGTMSAAQAAGHAFVKHMTDKGYPGVSSRSRID